MWGGGGDLNLYILSVGVGVHSSFFSFLTMGEMR